MSARVPGTRSPGSVLTTRLQRLVRLHRRTVAAGLVGLAVLLTLLTLAPAGPATSAVLVASRDLAPGVVIGPGDVHVAHRPSGSNPGALADAVDAMGRVLAAPVGEGEALPVWRFVAPGLLTAAGPGLVAAPLRLSDPAAAALLQPGDRVDVLAATDVSVGDAAPLPARVVADDLQVLSVVAAADEGYGSDPAAGLVVVAATRADALALAAAAAGSVISIVLGPPSEQAHASAAH